MIFQTRQPAFPLNNFVEYLIYFHGLTPTHDLDRFLPDGNTELIFDLTEDPQYIYDNETLTKIQTCRRAWVSGVRTRPITIPSGRGSRMLVVAFKKGKAYPFYPFPMHELTDRVVDADLVFGGALPALRERILNAASIDQMFGFVEAFLLQRAGDSLHANGISRCIEYAVSNMIAQPDISALQKLRDHIGYSQKHFIEQFKKQVGISPKQYLMILRFQKAVLEIENTGVVHWSRIALDSGYYDQAHFINDFKEFSGFTPNTYLRRKTDQLNYVPAG